MGKNSSPKLQVREVVSERWDDFDKLFKARGSPGYCWCMAWRADQKDPRSQSGAGRKALMKACIEQGQPVGLLGYLNEEPVAWCSLAPFETFHGLRKPSAGERMDRSWSVTCFFVRQEFRGIGLTAQLLAAAVRHARRKGARMVEAYAVTPDSPSYRHMGFISLFEEAGFTEVARQGSRRHVMQRTLRASPRGARPVDKA